jgi:microcystin degradation protein MlrC
MLDAATWSCRPMRIAVAMMSHETNTFSPVVTDLARFSGTGLVPPEGDAACSIFRGTASALGGFIRVCEAQGADMFIPVAAGAAPSGPVAGEAFEYVCERIIAAAGQCDAMLLDLHGAMVTDRYDDGEGELLTRIRRIAPDLPIAVSLDMHANLTEAMVSQATVICGYHTYPHVDMDETAARAARILFAVLAGRARPVMAWANAPMLPHVMRQGTDDFPNRELQQRARELEAGGALAVSLFTGFPHADIHDAGLSVVAVADADLAQAQAWRNELLDRAWAERAAFVYQIEDLELSLDRAQALAAEPGDGPVLLLDHYDNTASGGTMDTTEVLAGVLERGLDDVAFFGIFDPAAVAAMERAGVGNTVTVSLGGKLEMPALPQQSRPLEVTGRVKLLAEGRFPATVAMSRGLVMNMGKCGVLSVGGVDVVVISRHLEPFDPGCFRALGIEPRERRFLVLKSRVHYRVGFRDLVRATVACAGRGVCTSDYSELTFRKVRRPIFPLDGVNTARPEW